jgi:ABC-2 type transport system ATP-binding protein
LVRSTDDVTLAALLAPAGAMITHPAGGGLDVTGLTSTEVGQVALQAGIALSELTPQRASLEEAFMELTKDSVEYQATGGAR